MTSPRRCWWLRGSTGRRTRAGWPRSPVPSDADLWPGELPFTAWRQHECGTLDLRVFDQDVWWVNIAQQPHPLEGMSLEYISNVIGFLEAHVEYFYVLTVRREILQRYGDAMLGRVSAEAVAEAAGATSLCQLSPREWLESTPLMRRLRRGR
ncbi:hypothetical protein ACXR8F_21360 [Terrabacter sp. AAH1]